MIPKLGLSEENRKGVIDVLNTVLADEHVLYTKLRNYHWNVTGPQFHALHEFFFWQYDEVKAIADTVAERTRAHGGFAIGLERFLMQLLGLPNIRLATLFPRDLDRLAP